MKISVAVLGGGPIGLMAMKNLREDGFDVTLFETRAWVGGLWKHSDDESLSVTANTVFNSSKYRTAISDFPVPDDMDDYPTAEQLQKYFERYCDRFNLWPQIQLETRVMTVRRTNERWTLELARGNSAHEERFFDKVVIAGGSFVKPKQPILDGIELFKGKTLHAINYHGPDQFSGQNVLTMGMHASAQDIVVSLSKHASKVYMSHRSGVVLLPRYTSDGSVLDRMPNLSFTVISSYLSAWFPTLFVWLLDKLLKSLSKKAFPNIQESWGFEPAPSGIVSPPLIGDLYTHLQSGFAEPVPDIDRITGPKSVRLKSGRVLDNVDTIIYCTGYHAMIPVNLDPQDLNPYPYLGSPPNLYHHIFPLHPDPAIRNSLAFLCQGAVPYPGFIQYEVQAMCVSQLWLGNTTLPPLRKMQAWHRGYLNWREDLTKRYKARSTFYTFFLPQTDHLVWSDEFAGLGIRHHFGLVGRWIHWDAWKFWWSDRELWNICLSGLTSPAIFRLFDVGKRKIWSGARKQIFEDNERIVKQQRERLKMMEKERGMER